MQMRQAVTGRKIEQAMERALRWGSRSWKQTNTTVSAFYEGDLWVQEIRLHGNLIARAERGCLGTRKFGHRQVKLDHCGWLTATTKSRLNAVLKSFDLPMSVYQSKGKWFLWNPTTTVPSGPFDDNSVITLNP